jgi:hypothetical protein
MNTEFEQSESGECLRSCEPSEEQVRDEQAWSRMGDKGCPDDRHQPDPHQDRTGMEV